MTHHASKGTTNLHRQVRGALVAAVFLCLMGSGAANAAGFKEIDVDISPGKTVDTNVGCGFGLVTEWTVLGVDLYWPIPQPVNNSGLHACNPDNVWVKTSNYQWWCVGVEPFEEFWVVLWGVKGGGGGGGPSKRWMSVSDCDLDADTDNNSVGWPRVPDETDDEDKIEYYDTPYATSTVPGIALGVNDDHDEFLPDADPWGRDLDNDTADLDKEGTNYDGHSVGLAKLLVKVNAERDGTFKIEYGDSILRLFDEDGQHVADGYEKALSKGHYTGDDALVFYMECIEEDNYSPAVTVTFDPVGSPGVAEDAVTVTPVKMDIDVDSDNNGTIVDDNSQAEDLNEAKPGEPGMVVSLTEDPEEPPERDPNGVLRGLYSMTISDVLDPHNPVVTLKKVSGEGNVQVWKVREGEDPVLMLDTSENESTTTDGEGGSLWDLLKDCSDHEVIIIGVDDGEVEVGDVQLGLELTVNGAKVAMDVVELTVIKVDASDYMVPKSSKNVVRYSWPADRITPDSVEMEVYDKNETKVRTITGLPTTYASGEDYAEYFWNACKDAEGTQPLTETDSPYKIVVVLKQGGKEYPGAVYARKVKEWYLTIQVKDEEAYGGATVSGIKEDSITKTDGKFIVKRAFVGEAGSEEEIPTYKVVEENKYANATLMKDAGDTDYYLFYTTPTTPKYPEIKYEVTMKVSQFGCIDEAWNPWDMDDTTDDKWENKGIWVFKIDKDGNLGAFEETYAEE